MSPRRPVGPRLTFPRSIQKGPIMHSRARCGAAALVATFLAWPPIHASAQQATPARLDAAAASITAADFARHLGVLSHDSLKGRLTGTPGVESAARYIAAEFRQDGLKPLGGSDFIQRYALRYSTLDLAGTRLAIATN